MFAVVSHDGDDFIEVTHIFTFGRHLTSRFLQFLSPCADALADCCAAGVEAEGNEPDLFHLVMLQSSYEAVKRRVAVSCAHIPCAEPLVLEYVVEQSQLGIVIAFTLIQDDEAGCLAVAEGMCGGVDHILIVFGSPSRICLNMPLVLSTTCLRLCISVSLARHDDCSSTWV